MFVIFLCTKQKFAKSLIPDLILTNLAGSIMEVFSCAGFGLKLGATLLESMQKQQDWKFNIQNSDFEYVYQIFASQFTTDGFVGLFAINGFYVGIGSESYEFSCDRCDGGSITSGNLAILILSNDLSLNRDFTPAINWLSKTFPKCSNLGYFDKLIPKFEHIVVVDKFETGWL